MPTLRVRINLPRTCNKTEPPLSILCRNTLLDRPFMIVDVGPFKVEWIHGACQGCHRPWAIRLTIRIFRCHLLMIPIRVTPGLPRILARDRELLCVTQRSGRRRGIFWNRYIYKNTTTRNTQLPPWSILCRNTLLD